MTSAMIFASHPVGLPGLAAFALGSLAFLIALLAARARRGAADPGRSRRARRSWLGIALQAVGLGTAGYGPVIAALDPLGTPALLAAALIAALLAGAVALFVGATRALGRNWSLEARTRSDHELVRTGPFAHVRHPIYVALFLYQVALALAVGHLPALLVAAPLYALGTWLRVRDEEALLRAAFGAAYDAYAARVARFVPRLV